ncbi:MAG: hypothetical protein JNM00_03500 [Flavobacteriales bacterium]|nr:hypothetical protein [Flavobacteriales bacterium]
MTFRTFIPAALLLAVSGLSAQSTSIPMDVRMVPTAVDTMVTYTLELTASDLPHYSGIIYNKDRTIKARGRYCLENKQWLEDGPFVYFHANGKVESEGMFDRGQKVGEWRRFDENGTEKAPRYYDPATAEKLRALKATTAARQ